MCELCSTDPEERKLARDHARSIAERFSRLASHYRQVAEGHIIPHTEAFQSITPTAKAALRELFEDFV